MIEVNSVMRNIHRISPPTILNFRSVGGVFLSPPGFTVALQTSTNLIADLGPLPVAPFSCFSILEYEVCQCTLSNLRG